MLNKLHSIKKLMGLYDVAMRSGSNEIRLNTADVGLIVSDINKLLALVVETQVNKERTQPLDYAVTLEADGGKF
tara:strand:- start:413 stop:634 length:222 start_codon:yes stop_codon:yes gene_type:complete